MRAVNTAVQIVRKVLGAPLVEGCISAVQASKSGAPAAGTSDNYIQVRQPQVKVQPLLRVVRLEVLHPCHTEECKSSGTSDQCKSFRKQASGSHAALTSASRRYTVLPLLPGPCCARTSNELFLTYSFPQSYKEVCYSKGQGITLLICAGVGAVGRGCEGAGGSCFGGFPE